MEPSIADPISKLNAILNSIESDTHEMNTSSWEQYWDDVHKAYYYYNKETKVSQWEKPTDFRIDSVIPLRWTHYMYAFLCIYLYECR